MDLDVWACPVCRERLVPAAEGLHCSRGHTFRVRDGLPVLLRSEDEGLLADAAAYAAAWRQTPWAPPPGALRDLPYGVRGAARAYWEPKARSLEALLRLLGPARGRTVIDAGAGTGWLSHRLAREGFRCFATDGSADGTVGLGAAAAFEGAPVECAIAALDRWPLRDGCADVAVCNASLHYLRDVAPALAEARRVLRAGGRFYVLNSPVHADPRSARRASSDFRDTLRELGVGGAFVEGHRHFVAAELEAGLRAVFPEVRRHNPAFGAPFRLVRAAKGTLLRMELASFPIYEARRT